MEAYLAEYGNHFNRKLCDFAVDMMVDRKGNKLKPWDKEQTESFLRANGVTLSNNYGHDATYCINMLRADNWGSSIDDDRHLALGVKDFMDDFDGSETKAFDHFYIDCVGKGIPIFFEEML